MSTAKTVFYDPMKTWEENFKNGPFPPEPLPESPAAQPAYRVLGFDVNSPFGIPAGPLPTSRHTSLAFSLGFDILCYKTQRSVTFGVNQFPHVLSLDVDGDLSLEQAESGVIGRQDFDKDPQKFTITNSFGNPSAGPDFWTADLATAIKNAGAGQLLIMSVVGTIQDGFSDDDYFDDFARTAALAAEAGAPAIEINLSCPNVASEGVLCYTPASVASICQKVRQAIGTIPLVAKVGYFSADQQSLLEEVVSAMAPHVNAISAINTIAGKVYNENHEQALPGEGRLKSGCCGAGVKWAGLDMVKRLDALRGAHGYEYEIFGVGGVMTKDDFNEYRSAGADCVQSATGAMWNPNLGQEIRQSLAKHHA